MRSSGAPGDSPLEARLHGPPRTPAHPHVDARDPEEDRERRAGPPAHAEEGAAREHAQHRVGHAEHALGIEEQLEKRGLVVLVDELEERAEPVPDAPLVTLEATGLEAP